MCGRLRATSGHAPSLLCLHLVTLLLLVHINIACMVAGGSNRHNSISSVDVLNVDNNQWSTGPSIPTPWRSMKSTTISNTWYLIGGSYNARVVPIGGYYIS